MGIKREATAPRSSSSRVQGRAPDAEARFAPLLAKAWQQQYIEAGNVFAPPAFGDTRYRHSWAAECARKIHYRIAAANEIRKFLAEFETRGNFIVDLVDVIVGLELILQQHGVTEPLSVADHWRFNLGTMVHDALEAVVPVTFPTAEMEVRVKSDDGGTGHIDVVIRQPGTVAEYIIAIEIKTMQGFAFKKMIGDRGTPEGPRFSSFVQLALNAAAVNADEAVLVVLATENLSVNALKQMIKRLFARDADAGDEWRRFSAEYTYQRAEFEPVAALERKRMSRIVSMTDEGKLVPRQIPDPEIPAKARITDPAKGTWMLVEDNGDVTRTDSTWHCDYCENRQRCIIDGAS